MCDHTGCEVMKLENSGAQAPYSALFLKINYSKYLRFCFYIIRSYINNFANLERLCGE